MRLLSGGDKYKDTTIRGSSYPLLLSDESFGNLLGDLEKANFFLKCTDVVKKLR